MRTRRVLIQGDRSPLTQNIVQRAELYGEQVAATQRPDVMVFGELLNVIGAPGTYDQKAETIPGRSTDTMAALARGYNTYVAFGMLERDGTNLYNAAVLLDRTGTIVGKYRKTQVPLAELSGGIAPGADVRVFQTDFGKVALLICQDSAFPEPARQAAIQCAEVLLVPIWGGKQSAVAARALEHSVGRLRLRLRERGSRSAGERARARTRDQYARRGRRDHQSRAAVQGRLDWRLARRRWQAAAHVRSRGLDSAA